jgi:hypothetical protein
LAEAMQRFAAEAGISRYGQPEEIADLNVLFVAGKSHSNSESLPARFRHDSAPTLAVTRHS